MATEAPPPLNPPGTPGEWVVWIGMAIGAAVAGFVASRGWTRGGKAPPAEEKEMLLSGGAAITDLKPVRDLTEQVNLMTLQLMKAQTALDAYTSSNQQVAENINALAVIARDWIEQRHRDDEIDRLAEERARVLAEKLLQERLAERGVSTAPKKP